MTSLYLSPLFTDTGRNCVIYDPLLVGSTLLLFKYLHQAISFYKSTTIHDDQEQRRNRTTFFFLSSFFIGSVYMPSPSVNKTSVRVSCEYQADRKLTASHKIKRRDVVLFLYRSLHIKKIRTSPSSLGTVIRLSFSLLLLDCRSAYLISIKFL